MNASLGTFHPVTVTTVHDFSTVMDMEMEFGQEAPSTGNPEQLAPRPETHAANNAQTSGKH